MRPNEAIERIYDRQIRYDRLSKEHLDNDPTSGAYANLGKIALYRRRLANLGKDDLRRIKPENRPIGLRSYLT